MNVETAQQVMEQGIIHLGENRQEPFLEKYDVIGESAQWHFIGSLQSRKVKHVIPHVDYLHSLDRISLAKELDKHVTKTLKCFVQVKTSTEETKQGLAPEEVCSFIKELVPYKHIEVIGLMTMAPHTEDREEIRRCFRTLKEVQLTVQRLNLPHAICTELSMGMSNDYEIAIEEGATFIRLGTILVEKLGGLENGFF